MDLLEGFREHLTDSSLIGPEDKVLVGYSGGADSTCLLHLLWRAHIDVVAAHLHHGQRQEADEEERLCADFAEKLGVPFASGLAEVPKLARDLGIGLEEAGRQARYDFFARAAMRTGCNLIATAHTRDDNVETILFNLTRGSGMAGLAGIPEQRGNVVRPLLPFSRAQTREYCRSRGLWIHEDPANEDLSFSRARMRLRVLPELRAINPGADDAITRLAEIISEEDEFLNGAAAAALEACELPLNGQLQFLTEDCEIQFDKRRLLHLPPVLMRRALRLAVGAVGGGLDHNQTTLAEMGIRTERKGSITTEGGHVALEWNEKMVHVRVVQPDEPFRYPVTVPGETISDSFGWVIEAWPRDTQQSNPKRDDLEIELDKARLTGDLYLRSAQAGDEMQPLGFEGSRKLADLLSESKLTLAARKRLPIICDMIGPVWAPGVCLSQRVRPNDHTSRILALRFSPTNRRDIETAPES